MNLLGTPVDFLVVFLGGIVVSFTPCVYPLIPISVGYIGANSSGSRLKAFFLSLIYVTGIAVTYSLLGLLASLTGGIFGIVSSHSVTYIFVGVVIIFFGVSMLDLFTIPWPSIMKPGPAKKQSYFSTFLLGLTSGLIASPCLTPVLGAILAYLTAKNNMLYGITLLFSFAYGMGLILILSGTFSGILTALPRSDRWMVYIKKGSAFVLMGVGVYFIIVGLIRI